MRPVLLIVLDGFGFNPETKGNAIRLARTPVLTELQERYPTTLLHASSRPVGLPTGIMGNSEVGHLNLGAGRVVWQEITRIDRAIDDGSFYTNEALAGAVSHVLSKGTNLHLMGLVSDGGVHSIDRHIHALIDLAAKRKLPPERLWIHAFTDGRDTYLKSGVDHVARLEKKCREAGCGRVATLIGRYFAMDRDKRWERTDLAWRALVNAEGTQATDPVQALRDAYAREETDEFIKPVIITNGAQEPLGRIAAGDAIVFFNFRADRGRQLTTAFTDPAFAGFPRDPWPRVHYVTMTQYDSAYPVAVAFKPSYLTRILGEKISQAGLKQLRVAETEKYAHVTYFFNGGDEKPFPGEDRALVPSPKVATYDLQPEMSAHGITDKMVEAIRGGQYGFILQNFANPDMVGHTGVIAAAVQAVETVDECLGRIVPEVLSRGGALCITSDHGNCEVMIDPATGGPHTFHTTNPVPFVLVGDRFKGGKLRDACSLCDVAPTLLELLEMDQPEAMGGKTLIQTRAGM